MMNSIDALAYRFWSIHPSELDEWAKIAPPMPENYKGGMRAWFFACSMLELFKEHHVPEDHRPVNCRNRLRDEGRLYPKSGCASCGNGGLRGCPHTLEAHRPQRPSQQADERNELITRFAIALATGMFERGMLTMSNGQAQEIWRQAETIVRNKPF